MGIPKALVRAASGEPWIASTHATLLAGGCDSVLVVLGAEADEAQTLIPEAQTVYAENWALGMGESLAAGLRELQGQTSEVDAALIHLVDLPDIGADVIARIRAMSSPRALVRATYRGQPGHPVLIGNEHWPELLTELAGDEGARRYLVKHGVEDVECGDLASGHDVDTADGL